MKSPCLRPIILFVWCCLLSLTSVSLAQLPPFSTLGAGYGAAVDLDGEVAVVGAPDETIGGIEGQGAVYVYRRAANGEWNQEARLVAPVPSSNPTLGMRFGKAVAVSGNRLAIHAPLHSDGTGFGAIFLYGSAGSFPPSWVHTAGISVASGGLGSVGSLDLDGEIVAVGEPNAPSSLNAAIYSGKVSLRNWANPTFGVDVFPPGEPVPSQFGRSLALRNNRLAVGASGFDAGRGRAFVYEVSNPIFSNAFLRGTLQAADGRANDGFGSSISIAPNGRVIVGAPLHILGSGPAEDGAAYVFGPNPSFNQWTQEAKFTGPPTTFFYVGLGSAVGIDDRYAVTGSTYAGTLGGRMQIFRRVARTWFFHGAYTPPNAPGSDDRFPALSLSGNLALAGFPISFSNTGHATVFTPVTFPANKEIAVYTGPEDRLVPAPANSIWQAGEVEIYTTTTFPVTVHNDGGESLFLTGAAILEGASSGIALNQLPSMLPIAPGETRTILIDAYFSRVGTMSATLRIFSDDADEPVYDLPMVFRAVVPRGLAIARTANSVVITYPANNLPLYQVYRSQDLRTWDFIGDMQFTFDNGKSVMRYEDFSPPAGKAFYRIKVDF